MVSLADIITLINAIFGFLAIIMLLKDEIRIAFSFILLALLADGLDGVIARKLNTGKIGDYLEAMADMTSMAIAPMIDFVFVLMAFLLSLCCCHLIRSDHAVVDTDVVNPTRPKRIEYHLFVTAGVQAACARLQFSGLSVSGDDRTIDV